MSVFIGDIVIVVAISIIVATTKPTVATGTVVATATYRLAAVGKLAAASIIAKLLANWIENGLIDWGGSCLRDFELNFPLQCDPFADSKLSVGLVFFYAFLFSFYECQSKVYFCIL